MALDVAPFTRFSGLAGAERLVLEAVPFKRFAGLAGAGRLALDVTPSKRSLSTMTGLLIVPQVSDQES